MLRWAQYFQWPTSLSRQDVVINACTYKYICVFDHTCVNVCACESVRGDIYYMCVYLLVCECSICLFHQLLSFNCCQQCIKGKRLEVFHFCFHLFSVNLWHCELCKLEWSFSASLIYLFHQCMIILCSHFALEINSIDIYVYISIKTVEIERLKTFCINSFLYFYRVHSFHIFRFY